MKRSLFSDCMTFTLVACMLTACSDFNPFGWFGDSDKPKLPGTRIDALKMDTTLKADPALEKSVISLPAPEKLDYPQVGANAQHVSGNLALSASPKQIWKVSIGEGSTGDSRLLSTPIVVADRIYTLDSEGKVSALHLTDGSSIWTASIAPEGSDKPVFGGGLAYGAGKLYATTGAGEILALQPEDGKIIWRQTMNEPFRSAPSVSEGRLYAISIDSQLHVLNAATGKVEWTQSGIVEAASLLGMASPAVAGDLVVVPYSSGELFGLRAQNGHVVWSENLAAVGRTGSLPGMADIRALPVIEGDRIYALSHSGRMVALSLRAGTRLWDQDIGGLQTPVSSGDYLFLLTSRNEVIALKKEDGGVRWVQQLPTTTEDGGKGDPVFWHGPALGNSKLWVSSSDGRLFALSAANGDIVSRQTDLDPFFLPPIIANGTMLLLSDTGDLSAYR